MPAMSLAMSTKKKERGGGFQSFGLSSSVYKGVMKKGYRLPTPIQRKCIPLIIDGKDVVAMARTGSGKTAAFLLPMLEKLKSHSSVAGARALILSPTRELAAQTMKFTKELGKFTDLRSVLILGGDSMEDHFLAMHNNPDIIIATPGRFLHLVVEMELKLSSVDYVVFDEADRLFELGFLEQLKEILSRLSENRQSLLFSATLPKKLVEFAQAGLSNPVLVRLDVESKLSDQLKLSFFMVREDDKPAFLLHVLHHMIKEGHQTVLFTETKHHVEYFKLLCTTASISCTFIYSSLDQAARKLNVAKFVNKEVGLLIVTDVAARGIDIPLLDNVINYNFPATPKLFVHRVGRVARAGRSGIAFSMVSNDEIPYLLDLHLFLNREIKNATESSNDEDGVVGSVPQSVIDDQEEFIRNVHTTSSDLAAAKQVADNAHKQYIKSRVAPSADAIKRSRDYTAMLPPHPSLRVLLPGGTEKDSMLKSIKGYRPQQTIFEVAASRSKSVAAEVMKSKRQFHSKAILTTTQQRKSTSSDKTNSSNGKVGMAELSSELDLESFVTVSPWEAKRKKGKKQFQDDEHFIPYTPSDHHTEKGLSLGMSGFEQQASGAVLDLMQDEEQDMKRLRGIKKWDRKHKRFVGGETEAKKKKKIKTESGHWIDATYKSGVYDEWKSKHKIDQLQEGQTEPSDRQLSHATRKRQGGRWHQKESRQGAKVAGKRELRTADEILQSRKKAARNKYKQLSKKERAKRRQRQSLSSHQASRTGKRRKR